MSHRVERAKSSRSRCTTCDQPIEKGDARVAEEVNDLSLKRLIHRFYHLRCVTATQPLLVRKAIDSFVEPGLEIVLPEIEAKIAPFIEMHRAQRLAKYEATIAEQPVRAAAMPTEDMSAELLAQLEDEPDDEEALAVLGDQLAERGDPRGELIALQLATAHGQRDSPLAHRRTELMHQLAPPLGKGGRSTWGIGYLRRIELTDLERTSREELATLWSHPSTRLLSELHLVARGETEMRAIEYMRDLWPKTIRSLSVKFGKLDAGAVLAALPRLESLEVGEVQSFAELAHPRLVRLDVIAHSLKELAELDPQRLPAVTALTLHPARHMGELDLDAVCAWFTRSPWAQRVTHLGLVHGRLSEFGAEMLVRGLNGRRLVRLDLTGTYVRRAVRLQLATLCEFLGEPERAEEPDAAPEPWVEHATQPAWGRGRVLRTFDGKVEIEFPGVGRKVFQATAKFLRFGTD